MHFVVIQESVEVLTEFKNFMIKHNRTYSSREGQYSILTWIICAPIFALLYILQVLFHFIFRGREAPAHFPGKYENRADAAVSGTGVSGVRGHQVQWPHR